MKKIILWVLAYEGAAVLFLWWRRLAVAARGNTAYGGEVVAWLLPVAGYLIVVITKDWIAEIKAIREGGCNDETDNF